MAFRGIPPTAFDFYERLEADNSKPFWLANKATFDSDVKAPLEELCAELDDVGPFKVFRPYNDQRFSKNRPPYKTQQGAYAEGEGGTGYYFHIGSDGLMVAIGYYAMARDQLERFRAAVDDESTGPDVARIATTLESKGYSIGAIDELKSAPRGYPKDHPRIDLLRRKGLMASKQFPVAAWMSTKRMSTRIRDTWVGAAELCAWLDATVGPSTLPPDERDRFG